MNYDPPGRGTGLWRCQIARLNVAASYLCAPPGSPITHSLRALGFVHQTIPEGEVAIAWGFLVVPEMGHTVPERIHLAPHQFLGVAQWFCCKRLLLLFVLLPQANVTLFGVIRVCGIVGVEVRWWGPRRVVLRVVVDAVRVCSAVAVG